jgi:hypothetical protein
MEKSTIAAVSRRTRYGLPLILAVLAVGCRTMLPPSEVPTQAARPSSEHGYALLFDLLGDEKDVSKLRFIKRERADLNNLVKEISKVCGDAHKQLEVFGKADPALNLKDLGLPAAEMEARKAIGKTKEKALLTQKNKEFEVQLLLSQNEALTYGAHLAGVVAAAESNPQRNRFLAGLSQQLTGLQQTVFGTLLAKYSWPQEQPKTP